MGDSFIREHARPCRVEKIKGHITHALSANSHTPDAARKLRGKSGLFATSHQAVRTWYDGAANYSVVQTSIREVEHCGDAEFSLAVCRARQP